MSPGAETELLHTLNDIYGVLERIAVALEALKPKRIKG